MADITKLRVEACSVTFNGINIGHTKGGVVFIADRKFTDVTVDQYGTSPVDMILAGDALKIEVMFAEFSLANLKIAMPEGDFETAGAGSRLGMGRDAGFSLRSVAAQMILHPLSRAAGDTSEDVVIYKAVSSDVVELDYKVDAQRVYKVTFAALVDEEFVSGRRLGHIGLVTIS